jgi:hypothetical protein
MTHPFHLARLAVASTLALAAVTPALAATKIGGTPVPGSGVPWTNGPVDPLWKSCSWTLTGVLYSYTDPGRPISEIPGPPPAVATATPDFARQRSVSFSYLFSSLDLVVPLTFDGLYQISSSRVTVYRGPSASYALMFDRTVTGSQTSAASAATVYEGPLALGTAFNSQWTVRVQTKGQQWPSTGGGWKPATASFDCQMQVTTPTAPPPVLAP